MVSSMTDNEIIKALEVCSSNGFCNMCPFDTLNEPGCYNKVQRAALDIILRQKERMDRAVEQLEDLEYKYQCEKRYPKAGAIMMAIDIVKGAYDDRQTDY